MPISWNNLSWLTKSEVNNAIFFDGSFGIDKTTISFLDWKEPESWIIYKTKLKLLFKKIGSVVYIYKENGNYDKSVTVSYKK